MRATANKPGRTARRGGESLRAKFGFAARGESPAGHRRRFAMHDPAHPGEVLRAYLPAGMTMGEAARRLAVTRQTLSALVNRRAGVSAAMALRLAQALGTSAEMWLAMQATYDLWQARRKPLPRVSRIAA